MHGSSAVTLFGCSSQLSGAAERTPDRRKIQREHRYPQEIQAGQELLIIGASGSVGSAGVQLAKHFGAMVTAVCSGANVDLVKSLGADRVIDYTKEDFTSRANTYDLIFDIVGATSFRRCRHALKPRGIFLQNIMGLSGMVGIVWTSIVGGKKLKGGGAMDSPARMHVIAELVVAGKAQAGHR